MYYDIEDEFDGYWPYRTAARDIFVLRGTRPMGQAIGQYDGYAITEFMTDIDGNLYAYRGLAPRRRGGGIRWENLKDGHFVIEPGFVYEFVPDHGRTRPRLSIRRWLLNLLRFDLPSFGAQQILHVCHQPTQAGKPGVSGATPKRKEPNRNLIWWAEG